jgi:hypothetical protein
MINDLIDDLTILLMPDWQNKKKKNNSIQYVSLANQPTRRVEK